MPAATAPCGWQVLECGELPATGSADYTSIKEAAEGVLWALSGRQFGCCEVLLRPCRRTCVSPAGGAPWGPALVQGQWINVACGSCGDGCSCTDVQELRLPGPVCAVAEVKLDGAALGAEAWGLHDNEWLYRADGGSWPLCQEMALPDTEVGTWSVALTRGVPVPAGGQRALGEMMSELWKACRGDTSCCLPKRVQTVTRGGMTFALLDPMTFLEHGRTGLYWTDLWLSAVNPLGRPSGARVLSPDMPREWEL